MKKLIVYKDIGNYDAPTNLAINEVILETVKEGQPVLRVYTFASPGLILAKHESIWDVRNPDLATRRNTGGSVIYVDETTLGYTAFFHKNDLASGVTDVYKQLTRPIAERLRKKNNLISLGALFSIRHDGKVIAGHAQYNKKDSVQYDGIAHISRPNITQIESLIKLRDLCSVNGQRVLAIDDEVFDLKGDLLGKREDFNLFPMRHEKTELESMPGLDDLNLGLNDYIEILRESFSSVFKLELQDLIIPERVISSAKSLVIEKYRNPDWVSSGKRRALGHCFVDLVDPEI